MMAMLVTSVGIWVSVLGGPDSSVREAALDSLVVSGQVAEVNQAVFENGWRTRDGLITVLERMGAVDGLVQVATHHAKQDAQRLAIRSLGRCGQVKAKAPLRALLTSEHRDLAVEALGLVGDVSDIVRVRVLLMDERADVRRRAALSLVKLAGVDAVADLVLLLGDVHHSVRFAVFNALLAFEQQSAAAALAGYSDLPETGKVLALRLFAQVQYDPALAILEGALSDSSWPIQLTAVRAVAIWQMNGWETILKKAEKRVSSPVVMQEIREILYLSEN